MIPQKKQNSDCKLSHMNFKNDRVANFQFTFNELKNSGSSTLDP